jgi:thiamine biosynthesis lipoprotein
MTDHSRSGSAPLTLACHAMATRFELVLPGEDHSRLRAAGEEAIAEIERLDARLSFYRPDSEISNINLRAAQEPVHVAPDIFRLLDHARRISAETGGAFDITVAPLLHCWGFTNRSGRVPTEDEIESARARVGMQHVELDEKRQTVRFTREGVMLDLGSIGKGFALERATLILREAGVTSALVHGGTSTVQAIGTPPDADAWTVAIGRPPGEGGNVTTNANLASVALRDEALSVSGVSGKSFTAEGRTWGHVLDPRTGWPVSNAVLAAVVLPSATESDALSTALLASGPDGGKNLSTSRTAIRWLVASRDQSATGLQIAKHGI